MASEAPQSTQTDTLNLYSFYSSSCGQRVLIAAALKQLELNYIPVNMRNKEHRAESFRALNPSGALPVLEVVKQDGTKVVLAQSVAILEYLEEAYPDRPPLLPTNPVDRAIVRQMVGVMVSDAFPPSNSRIARKVRAIRDLEEDEDAFVREVNLEAFVGYEGLVEHYGGKFSFGDKVTLADVCLVPQVVLAGFYGFKLEDHASLKRTYDIYQRLLELNEVKKSGWRNQIDTPEKSREPQ